LATTVLAKPLSGRLSDRLGRKPMIVAGLFLCAVTLPAIPAFASFWLLLLPSALFGLRGHRHTVDDGSGGGPR